MIVDQIKIKKHQTKINHQKPSYPNFAGPRRPHGRPLSISAGGEGGPISAAERSSGVQAEHWWRSEMGDGSTFKKPLEPIEG